MCQNLRFTSTFVSRVKGFVSLVNIESHLMRNYAMSSIVAKVFFVEEGRGKNIARCRSTWVTIDKVNSKRERSNKSVS
jgi:hypothetical protein